MIGPSQNIYLSILTVLKKISKWAKIPYIQTSYFIQILGYTYILSTFFGFIFELSDHNLSKKVIICENVRVKKIFHGKFFKIYEKYGPELHSHGCISALAYKYFRLCLQASSMGFYKQFECFVDRMNRWFNNFSLPRSTWSGFFIDF